MTTDSQPNIPDGAFHTTRWSRVCLAKADSEDGRRALSDLCAAYYEPVLVFMRYEFREADLAREMSHSFFEEMLSGGTIRTADRERGRFRSYLLGSVKHFLSHQRESFRRQKRGGGHEHTSLDDEAARAIADESQCPPDLEFDRQWATTLLGHALDALQSEYESKGKAQIFEQLKPWLTGDAEHGDQRALAASLGMNINTLKGDILRLKQRFQTLVKEEVAGTVSEGDSVKDELAILFAALRKS